MANFSNKERVMERTEENEGEGKAGERHPQTGPFPVPH